MILAAGILLISWISAYVILSNLIDELTSLVDEVLYG